MSMTQELREQIETLIDALEAESDKREVQEFRLVDELSNTQRGTGGFGSTGRGV